MAKKNYKTAEQRKKEIDDLTEIRNTEVENFFNTPDQIKEYLGYMSKFYNYSVRNSILIQKQFKGAEAVGSFKFWKDQGHSVQKGEKGIKILTPFTYKTFPRDKDNKNVKTPLKYATKEEKDSINKGEIKVDENIGYRTGHVFDVSQTSAKPEDLPELFPNKGIDGELNNYDDMYRSLEKLANNMDVQIHKEPMDELGVSKGQYIEYTQPDATGKMERKKGIELNPRNSEVNNVKTLVHELAHAKLHNTNSDHWQGLNHNEKEFQAEMTAYTVCSHFNIDTSDYSLQYLHAYTKNHDSIRDKMQLLDEVKDTSYEFVTHLEGDLVKEQQKGNTLSSAAEEDKELQNEYKDVEIIKDNQVVSIGELSSDEFKQVFHDKHDRNVLNRKEFQGLDQQEAIKEFNSISDNWSNGKDAIKMVDNTLSEPHAYVVRSESLIEQDLKPLQEMDRALANNNVESLADMGYDKTEINYVIPTDGKVEIKSAGRVDLGDSDYSNLHDHVKQENKELADITPKTDLSDIYSTENMTNKLKSVYSNNLQIKERYNKDDFAIERSDAGLDAVENFSKKQGTLTDDDIKIVKENVRNDFYEQKEYQDAANNVVNLKGDYQKYQELLDAEDTGELTGEKITNRMNAENSYFSKKQNVLNKYNESNDVISKMESDAMQDFRYEHKDSDVKENPFGQSKSNIKKKEQGLSM